MKTSLYEKHLNLKAKMAPFAGYEMPIQYSSVKEEVLAVRNSCGVFDVSHMGEFFVKGKDATKFIDYIMTNDYASADLQKAVYSPICRENGTVIDDLIAYKLSENKSLICVNAANIQKDWDWISSKAEGFDIKLSNESESYSLLAVQGPKTEEIFKKIEILNTDASYYSAQELTYNNEQIILARTGYTGEDGFEVFGNHKIINELWDKLLDNNVVPCGLASRDVLRLEVCYPLYGHEINDNVTPLDAALKWTVKFKKESFIGKESLKNYSPKYQLIKLKLEKGIPRENYKVFNANEEEIGIVTSGTMSVILGKGIALAHIEKEKMPEDKKFFINIRNKNYEAEYLTSAFIKGGHK